MRGSVTSAVALFGLYAWPTPRRTSSALAWIWASSVSWMSCPGFIGVVSLIEIGSPRASRTIRRSPSLPCSVFSSRYSRPAPPMPSDFTVPRTCDASQSRGYSRRLVGVRSTPAMSSLRTFAARPRGQLAREVDEAAALGELVEQVAHRDAEDRGELRGRAPRVLDEVRRRGDVARGLGHRELGAGAVGDRPALRGQRDVDDLLRRGGVLEGAGVDEADPAGAQDGDAEQDEEDREEQADAALRQPHRA